MYEMKKEVVYDDFSKDKEMFDFSNYSDGSKYYDNSNKLVIGKMKDETVGITINEFVGLKPKMYLSLLDDSSEHKKANGVYKSVVEALNQDEYKDVLLNKKSLRHSTNRIQSKDHRIGTYKINEIFLSFLDNKIYIKNNGYHGLALGYQS